MGDIGDGPVNNGSGIQRKESNVPVTFDDKMKKPQLYALQKEWRKFKQFFKTQPEALVEPFDWAGNTALHVVTRSNNPQLLRKLLGLITDTDQRGDALKIKNAHGNTVLHHVILCSEVEMEDVLVGYKVLTSQRPEEIGKRMAKEEKELLEIRNVLGETLVCRAYRCGRIHMLVHLRRYYLSVDDLLTHFPKQVVHNSNICSEQGSQNSKNQEKSILYLAIAGQYMVLPVPRYLDHRYESCGDGVDDIYPRDDSIKDRCQERDIESRKDSEKQHNSVRSRIDHVLRKFITDGGTIFTKTAVLSKINRAFWTLIAQEWDVIDDIWEKNRQHRLAKKLAHHLVKGKGTNPSWWQPFNLIQVVSPKINPPNVHRRRIKAKLNKTQFKGEAKGSSFDSPLLLATSTGIVEIVECIIEQYPEAIAHVEGDQNVLHVAVKHRQRKIYCLIKKYGSLKWLASEMGRKGRTVLHQAARMDYYNGGKRSGVVFQLQDELLWFERVKKAIPPALILHCSDDNITASELFDIEHEEMLREAQEWIKGTAQSCSAVAVLVATVVFAAAFTVPGGTNDNGIPIFIDSPLFLFFTIADVAALACSLVSVMMFLSILTSPFEMENFLKSLPRKLTLGFTLLFCSLTITMLAFSSTIFLTIRLEKNKWTTSLIYCVTFFPVALFGLMQFPIYMAVKHRLKRVLKTCKKVLPRRFTKGKYSKFVY